MLSKYKHPLLAALWFQLYSNVSGWEGRSDVCKLRIATQYNQSRVLIPTGWILPPPAATGTTPFKITYRMLVTTAVQ